MPPTPHQRTRQGCLTCRKRRRKCDERKPLCQNCTERGIICRYGIQLIFRPANHINLVSEDANSLRETTPKVYKQIRFVDGLEDDEDFAHDDLNTPLHWVPSPTGVRLGLSDRTERNPSPKGILAGYHDEHDEAVSGLTAEEDQVDRDHQPPASNPHPQVILRSPEIPPYDHSTRPRTPYNFDEPVSNRYVPHSSSSAVDSSPVSRVPRDISGNRQLSSTIFEIHHSTTLSKESSTNGIVPTGERNRLLKYYVDKVAPKLDICTPRASYGIHVSTLSKNYTPLLYSILALAAQQQLQSSPRNTVSARQSSDLAALAFSFLGSDLYSDRQEVVAAQTLLVIRELMSSEMRHWKNIVRERVNVLSTLGIDGFTDGHRGAAAWTILRLGKFRQLTYYFQRQKVEWCFVSHYGTDLAQAMSSRTPLVTAVEEWRNQSQSFPDDTSTGLSEEDESPEWTRRSILLCSQAAQICFSTEPARPTATQTATGIWSSLYHRMRSWSEKIPLSMQAILTSPISSTRSAPPYTFPLILYTCRSDMFAAIMHHNTSILLLQSKPPITQSTSYLKSATWHSVQICGICLANNTSWSHDPTILAVLVYVGRFISFHEQRTELLEALRLFVKESGLLLNEPVDDMMTFWRLDGG
ncbi:hypothetical protein BKA64DRAFT_670801 [Cadophora sp. MPI-SDFR-AT-0126]|nr:hypothetical protein BKA64DRAFT_670801 [Leotiomycetes sp. MPI-SDFR-AT-0126]